MYMFRREFHYLEHLYLNDILVHWPMFFTGRQLYLMIAEFIPKLKSRQGGAGGGAEGKGAAGTSKKKKKKK